MPKTSIQDTRKKTVQLYAAGVLAFSAVVGALTLVVLFVSHLNTN